MTDNAHTGGKAPSQDVFRKRDELLPDLAETLAELFRAVEEREPRSVSELGRWVEGLGAAIVRAGGKSS